MAVSPVSGVGVIPTRVQNTNPTIDKNTCALTEAEEREFLSTRNVQHKTKLADLGKERAKAIALVNDHFDAPIENISQELGKQGSHTLKESIESTDAKSSEEALYSCSTLYDVQRLTLAAAYATIRDYTYVHDSQEGRYFYPPNGSVVNLDELVKGGNYEEVFTIAASAIDALRDINERTLAEVLEK